MGVYPSSELSGIGNITRAYMDGELDIEGDLLAALSYQERLGDFHPAIYLWRRVKPILLGRPRVNPAWIALHYDAQNARVGRRS